MKRTSLPLLIAFIFSAGAALFAQGSADIVGVLVGEGEAPRLAIPDLSGPAGQSELTTVFNDALWDALSDSGQLDLAPKSFYPRVTPRKPDDIRLDRENLPDDPSRRGLYSAGWSEPPIAALYLVYGQLELVNERMVLNGFVYDVTAETRAQAQVLGKRYYGDLDARGTRALAHDFARDILQQLGLGMGIAGSRIYYVSRNSAGHKEIWAMDYDGQNKEQLTKYRSICLGPAVSPDGLRLAFTTFREGTPKLYMHSLETGRRLQFYNQDASLNTTPTFTPDGESIIFASSASGSSQIYEADLDGRNLRRISYSRTIDVHPHVNPKTGQQIVFTSGQSGIPQVYIMDKDGANRRRLSGGQGDAVQAAWDPQGENITFSWTRGFEPGNYNVFIMNVATEKLVQLTFGQGRNEHPTWSPSGTHIVFASDRDGTTQIWTMRADGNQLKKLTTQGQNEAPFWAER